MFVRLLLSLALATLTAPLFAQTFTPNDQVVSDPTSDLFDMEFDRPGFNLAWQDNANNLWVAKVDENTGAFVPPNGRGQRVDTGLVPIAVSGNGPEWAFSAAGSLLVYSKLVNNTAFLGLGRFNGRSWRPGLMPGTQGGRNPFGSIDYTDAAPRVRYNSKPIGAPGASVVTWREIANPDTITVSPNSTAAQGRWVAGPGQRALSLTIKSNGIDQGAFWDIDTNLITQTTFDPGQKDDPFTFNAPEFNNEQVFIIGVDKSAIGVYRNLSGVWTQVNLLKAPTTQKLSLSAEPFVYNGKSYVFWVASDASNGPSDVWIGAIDPANPLLRKVSGTTAIVRQDPEYMITRTGVFVYYTEKASGGLNVIHRCDTGLGLPVTWPQY